MSDTRTAQFVGDSIEEMLVSLAEGVREAQQALSAVPAVDAYGRPQPTYHLPYLDFDLAVKVVMQSSTGGGRPFARLLPMGPSSSSSGSTEVSGTIKGRLVAVPPQQGLPLPVLRLTLGARVNGSPTRQALVLEAANTAGELLAGQAIELNIDPAASRRLSPGITWPATLTTTKLQQAVLRADDQGRAEAWVELGADLPSGTLLVVVASIGPAKAQGVVTV